MKEDLYVHLCFPPQILGGAISAVITYHNPENMPKDGICVANHTSPIDVLILACDNAYALVREGPRFYYVQVGGGLSYVHVPRELIGISHLKLLLFFPLQIGQRHKGFIGMFEETLSKCAHHIWFERSESKDRQIITQR